jgi:hypothetical protein
VAFTNQDLANVGKYSSSAAVSSCRLVLGFMSSTPRLFWTLSYFLIKILIPCSNAERNVGSEMFHWQSLPFKRDRSLGAG